MLNKIIDGIKLADKIALFHHINPDGDTLSSSYGLALALRSKFPNKEIKVVANKEDLFRRFEFIDFKEEVFIDSIDETWTTVVGDTSDIKRIDRSEEFLKGSTKICFDHHQNDPTMEYDIFWKESSWIASSLQAVEIAKALNVEFDKEIAFHLAIGILTDSGNFAFSLGDPMPMKSYGFLLGFMEDSQIDHLFNSMRRRTKKDIEIEKFMWNNVQYKENLTYLKVTMKDLEELGVEEKDVKMKVNRMGNIEGFDRWALFTEVLDKEGNMYIKGSTRSLGCNVSKVAMRFNGGGHVRAAGVQAKDWNEVEEIITALIAAE
ncbi:MAG: DHH family phosphoesterase [Mycoplasmatales bacterium]|nr:DHH family phosphoesterase [Mycoplasmatales bacterium]